MPPLRAPPPHCVVGGCEDDFLCAGGLSLCLQLHAVWMRVCVWGWGVCGARELLVRVPVREGVSTCLPLPPRHWSLFDPPLHSPGMQISLNVSFRPVQMEEYDDFVEVFVTNKGTSFKVPVVARLPRLAVRLEASSLDLGLIPVGEVTKGVVRLENSGASHLPWLLCVYPRHPHTTGDLQDQWQLPLVCGW